MMTVIPADDNITWFSAWYHWLSHSPLSYDNERYGIDDDVKTTLNYEQLKQGYESISEATLRYAK